MLHNVPLCEHCSSSVISATAQGPNVSVVFCMNDGVFLCATCNDEVHKNKIAQRHVRVSYSDAPAWAYQEALAAGRVTSQAVECSSSPNTEPACLALDVVGESSWTPPPQPATASSLDSAQPAYKSESASCVMNMGLPHHKKQPSLLSHYTMAISTPDTFSDDAGAHHSNSNSYTPGSLGAEVAQEETQQNASRLKLLGPGSEPTNQQQQQQQQQEQLQQQLQQQQQQRMQQLPTQPPSQHSVPLSHSVFSMQTIQEQQVIPPMSAPSLQHQQLYAMRHPHGCHSHQGSAHGGMACFGVQPPFPLNRCGSQEPSSHGGTASVDTTMVAGSANSHGSLAAMLERFGMPSSRETSHHGTLASPFSGGAAGGGLSGNLEGSVHSTGTFSGLAPTSQPQGSQPSSQGLHPGMLNFGVEEGSVPSRLHRSLVPDGQSGLGHAHKMQKLGSRSPDLMSKEQSIRDVIMAEVGFPRMPMSTSMDEDLPSEGPGATTSDLAIPGLGTGISAVGDSGTAETLGMPPTHAPTTKHLHPHSLHLEHTGSSFTNAAASGGVEGLGMPPGSWHNHQGLPSEHLSQQQQKQQQGHLPSSEPMHLNFPSGLSPELRASLQHGNGVAPHHLQQQQQHDAEQLPLGLAYRPTPFQLSALNIKATPQSVIEARARALINSSSRTKGGPHQHRNHKGGAHKVPKGTALDGSDSDESGSASKLKKGTKAKQADKKGRAKVSADQRARGRGQSAKAEGSEVEVAAVLRAGSGPERSKRSGSMQRIDEEVDQAASKGKQASKSKQGALTSPRVSASPRPSSLQRTSSGHGGSASAGSTAKGGGSAKGSKGLGSASGGVVKNSSHHAHAGQSEATFRRTRSCTDMHLDQSTVQKLVAAIQANPSAAPSALLPNLPPQLQRQILRSLSNNPAFQQQLQHQQPHGNPGPHTAPASTLPNKPRGSMPVPVPSHPNLPACTNPPLTWEGNMGGLLAGASSWSQPSLLTGPSSWSHPSLLATQDESRHDGGLAASTHGGSLYLESLDGAACGGGDPSVHGRGGVGDRSAHGTEGSTHGGNSAALWGVGGGEAGSTHAGSTMYERSTHGGSLFGGDGGSVHGGGSMLEVAEAEAGGGCLATELLASLDQDQGDMLDGENGCGGDGMGAAEGSLHGGSLFGRMAMERLDDHKLRASPFPLHPPGAHDVAAPPTMPSLSMTSGLGGGMREAGGEPQQSPLISDEDLEALCVGMEDPAHGPGALPLPKPFNPSAIAPSLKLGSYSPRPDFQAFPFHHHSNGSSMDGFTLQRHSEPGPSPLGPAPAAPVFGGVGTSKLQNVAPVSLQALQMQMGPQAGHENTGYGGDVFADQQVCSMLDALLDDHM